MSAYWEKLKDPRWQKLRLEAMQKADFHCERCGDGESTLNVHHKEYFKGREPWEYKPKQLLDLKITSNYNKLMDYIKTNLKPEDKENALKMFAEALRRAKAYVPDNI
jgi:methionyl-tRNA synthetase